MESCCFGRSARKGFLTKILTVALSFSLIFPGSAFMASKAWAILVVPPPGLNPLNQTPVPEPPQLSLYVKSKAAAVALGKAFFWDMQAGSDGIVACATCHHSAGADKRLKNTLNPGTKAGDTTFGNSGVQGVPGYPQFGPNYTLDPVNDFPLHRRQNEGHLQSDPVIQDTNDVVGSQGVRLSDFVGVGAFSDPSVDSAPASEVDPVFNLDYPAPSDPTRNVRRVTARNAPTVIDAIFNFTTFHDGRANMRFNGENPFGPADQNAGVWFDDPGQPDLVKRPVVIEFASLASQATGPPVDTVEMSGRGRTFPILGRKMLGLTPLGKQVVSHDDSVLGGLAKSAVTPGAKGLHTGYDQLIKDAFQDNLWNSPKHTPDGFTQMEANFSLFWGLAIQLYEATLISDNSPFDLWLAGDSSALTEHQQFGFSVFSGIGNCTVCHLGIEFTDHSVATVAFQNNAINNTIELMFAADGVQNIYDEGFTNNAIRPTAEDIGRGGNTPFKNPLNGEQPYPLSFSSLAVLQTQGLLPFETPILQPFIPIEMPINTPGAFKVPGLRNVELTGPYFHNGSEMTLDSVLNFYSRGGNFPAENIRHLDPVIGAGLTLISNNQPLHEALTDFLTALTDPRVRNESAPFDHPEIFIPEGDPEVLIHIPARSSDGSVFLSTFSLNAVTTPTTQTSQILSGTVQTGLTPMVTVNPAAAVGPVTVVGENWSCQVSGLALGDNVITVSVVDSLGMLRSLTATITVMSGSDPLAMDDTATTMAGVAVTIPVLANDSDPGGALDPASVRIKNDPLNGIVRANADGTITYTPNPGFIGPDSFTYRVRDVLHINSNEAQVNVTVTPPNSPPVAADNSAITSMGSPVVIHVLDNDSDADGTLDPASVAIKANPFNGTAVSNADGTVTYTPNGGFLGIDGFAYTVRDNLGAESNAATVFVTVNRVPNPSPETINVTQAKYTAKKGTWAIKGTSTAPGSALEVRVGPDFKGSVVGYAVVSAKGKFKLNIKNSLASPDATNAISILSSNGTLSPSFPVLVK